MTVHVVSAVVCRDPKGVMCVMNGITPIVGGAIKPLLLTLDPLGRSLRAITRLERSIQQETGASLVEEHGRQAARGVSEP